MVSICTKLASEPRVRAIAEAHDSIWYTFGIHPMSVADHPPVTVEDLVRIAQHPKLIGIGETGLDYHYTADTAALQQASLRIHIEAARQTGLPLIIHARAADDDMARILTEEWHAAPYTCVMHCFSSGPDLARAALDLGFYLSVSGIAAFPRSQELRDIFATAPLDRILVETDSPYLAPPPHRGKRNEPAYVALTAAACAHLWNQTPVDFARATSANFDRLFTKSASAQRAA
jgi:TatD DNase family protein